MRDPRLDETAFFQQLLKPDLVKTVLLSRLRYLLQNAKLCASKVSNIGELTDFLASSVCLENLGSFMVKVSLSELLDGHHVTPYEQPSCGLLKDLNHLRIKRQCSFEDMSRWWFQLTGVAVDIKVLKQVTEKMLKQNKKLHSNSYRAGGAEVYQSFLMSPPFAISVVQASTSSNSTPPSASSAETLSANLTPKQQNTVTADQQALASAKKTMAALRGKLQEQEQELKTTKEANRVLSDLCKQKSASILLCEEKMSQSQEMMRKLQSSLEERKKLLDNVKTKISTIQSSNYYKRLKRTERCLKKKESIIRAHEQGHCESTIKRLRREKKLLQTQVSNTKQTLNRHRASSELRIAQLEQAIEDLVEKPDDQQNQKKIYRLKDEHGHFTSEARVCIMALVGESEVPAHRCGVVIQTVVQQVLGARVPVGDLPSQRSALRISDQAHVMSKAHVAQVLLQEDFHDLHVDGTSRGGQKYIAQAVTTTTGTHSLGFTSLAMEDTTTLVEVTLQMLEELSGLHTQHEAQQNFLDTLSRLSAVMTDRASVMKSFTQRLQHEGQVLLQTDEGLDFLHCNAHFLLGLPSEVRKVLLEEDEARREPGWL